MFWIFSSFLGDAQVNDYIKQLPSNVPQLLQEVLRRLELDHGATLMKHVMLLLSCAREGTRWHGVLDGYQNLHSNIITVLALCQIPRTRYTRSKLGYL